jgi:hypothetical protein
MYQRFETHRTHLRAVANRMLGSIQGRGILVPSDQVGCFRRVDLRLNTDEAELG